VVAQPTSGAVVTIVNGQLTLDYFGITFVGPDELTIEVCDAVGICTTSVITIEVSNVSEVSVFNAVAPKGSSDENRYLHINGLPEQNRVTVYNRWGDLVYKTEGYDNKTKRFEGLNDNGKELPSGPYFYKVEYIDLISGEQFTKPGYLTLKQ
jgi:gliding motility-associated-like protein